MAVEVSSGKPYVEKRDQNRIRRKFYETVAEEELIWHRDRKNRYVKVVESNGWKFQYDNELPINLEEGKTYFIEAMKYHRVLKGQGNLVVEIRED